MESKQSLCKLNKNSNDSTFCPTWRHQKLRRSREHCSKNQQTKKKRGKNRLKTPESPSVQCHIQRLVKTLKLVMLKERAPTQSTDALPCRNQPFCYSLTRLSHKVFCLEIQRQSGLERDLDVLPTGGSTGDHCTSV